MVRAFSGEVDTGSRKENASNLESGALFRFHRNGSGASMLALFRTGALLAIPVVFAVAQAKAEDLNDYPTSARADYIFGCMKANGETQELLQKCSCSIDVIASIIPYDRYVTAETILSMSQVTGPVGSEFRSTEPARLALQEFRRAQAEAEIRCF